MRSALAVSVVCLGGCGGDPKPAPSADADVPPSWWQPKVGEAKNWDIQLSASMDAPFDVSMPRVMYDLDLWELVPLATTLDYGDGNPVTVKPGKLAGRIAQLHARTPSTIVICHVETGVLDLNLPDAHKFPGYMADPTKIPDNPDAPAPGIVTGNPAAGSVIGWSLGTASKRLLDVREASRAGWASIMFKRFDLARSIGCDGIEPAYNDVEAYTSGFTIPTEQTYSWYADVAKQGHDRMLSTGMKNGDTLGAVDKGAEEFDWLMIERCGETNTCDVGRPFIDLSKAVLAIDYDTTIPDDNGMTSMQLSTQVCPNQVTARIQDGLFKDVALTSSKVRTPCDPDP